VRAGAAGTTAWIEIANTADGIDPEELPHLFERFYRRDNGAQAGQAGSGLGLPIARDLAELLGGTLSASVSGDSLVMRVELPSTPH
jgi:signal transduction histidine kinase